MTLKALSMDAIVSALHAGNEAPHLSSLTCVTTNLEKELLFPRTVLLVVVLGLFPSLFTNAFVCIYIYIVCTADSYGTDQTWK